MKITIDLNDPAIQAQLQQAIGAKVNELAAARLQASIDAIIETKLARLTPDWVDKLTKQKIEELLRPAFAEGYGRPSDFRQVLAALTEKLLREKLSQP